MLLSFNKFNERSSWQDLKNADRSFTNDSLISKWNILYRKAHNDFKNGVFKELTDLGYDIYETQEAGYSDTNLTINGIPMRFDTETLKINTTVQENGESKFGTFVKNNPEYEMQEWINFANQKFQSVKEFHNYFVDHFSKKLINIKSKTGI